MDTDPSAIVISTDHQAQYDPTAKSMGLVIEEAQPHGEGETPCDRVSVFNATPRLLPIPYRNWILERKVTACLHDCQVAKAC